MLFVLLISITVYARSGTAITSVDLNFEYDGIPSENNLTIKVSPHSFVKSFNVNPNTEKIIIEIHSDSGHYFAIDKASQVHMNQFRYVDGNLKNGQESLRLVVSWDYGKWMNDEYGTRYEYLDGTCKHGKWYQIDGKFYYFDDNGYLLKNTTTPDGYHVDENGVWSEE
jgi:hypothetical protein